MEVYMSKYEIENVKLTAPKLDRNDLEYAMTYRYACKKFDSTKKISDDDWNAIQETLYLNSIPGMYDSLKSGIETPLSECISEKDVEW